MTLTIPAAPLSAEAFWRLPDDGTRRELIQGEVVASMPPGGIHGGIALDIGMRLRLWADERQAGYVGVEAGFLLARNPDTLRGPDVAYVQASRIPAAGVPGAFWELAPDLAVEVVSPGESAEDVRDKVADYLQAGTRLVWVVYPRQREVVAHTADGLARTFTEETSLEAPVVLPGFACPVADLFSVV